MEALGAPTEEEIALMQEELLAPVIEIGMQVGMKIVTLEPDDYGSAALKEALESMKTE